MTAKTSQHLAAALSAAGFKRLARRARRDEFHDFLSPHDTPDLLLDSELTVIAMDAAASLRQRMAAQNLRQRLHDGEFDASLEESDDWAASPEGQDAFRRLTRGD